MRSAKADSSSTAPPFYALFFVIAGAELCVGRVPSTGALGLAYILGRAVGKFGSARLGAWRLRPESSMQRYLGFVLLAQSGLAVGLTLAVTARYPVFAPMVTTVVLASVAVFEMFGPTSARFALARAGEAGAARNAGGQALPAEL